MSTGRPVRVSRPTEGQGWAREHSIKQWSRKVESHRWVSYSNSAVCAGAAQYRCLWIWDARSKRPSISLHKYSHTIASTSAPVTIAIRVLDIWKHSEAWGLRDRVALIESVDRAIATTLRL